ncbi:MAG: flagellar basal-body rod protein FlgG [Deltaproteobacteria bacterium]|nr:flagellar basal-body rod protein FlgG [Deltaproteobacteria bacterium]
MLRSLWIAATGMEAQQLHIDTISNNLANVNTAGFKKSRADFEDLMYQTAKMPGATSSPTTQVPTGIQIGQGVRPVATQRIFTPGNLQQTGNSLDLAIEGDGFFQITTPEGNIAYTRDGTFKLNSDGNMVTSDGYQLEPAISIPSDAVAVYVSADGIVSVKRAGSPTPQQAGNVELARFVNPAGLQAIGKNLYLQTASCGDPTTGVPGAQGIGTLAQSFLEMSNVSVVEEMVNMIVAQRAYEINSKSIQAADEMLQMANNLRR